jgi:pimeloyl-ACP methyl ester carboxylesterase
VLFGGFLTSSKDDGNGTMEMARCVKERAKGSVALFSWRALRKAKAWAKAEAEKRRGNGEVPSFAVAGHSWGGDSACKLTEWILDEDSGNRVTALITLDAVRHGFVRQGFAIWLSCATLACVTSQRHGFMAMRDGPTVDGTRLARHIHYYERDTSTFHGLPMRTTDENHLEWRDGGHEVDHGNMDGLLAETVAEDIRRSFDPAWSIP